VAEFARILPAGLVRSSWGSETAVQNGALLLLQSPKERDVIAHSIKGLFDQKNHNPAMRLHGSGSEPREFQIDRLKRCIAMTPFSFNLHR
jgi:hypothetical protein